MGGRPRAFRILAVAASLALPAGCGFHPLYGESSGAGSAELQHLRIAPIVYVAGPLGYNYELDRTGQLVRNALLDRLQPRGAAGTALYELHITLGEAKSELAIRSDETATRGNLSVSASYGVIRLRDGKTVAQSSANSVVSYNILRNAFSTVSSETAARERATREIADSIANRAAAAINADRSEAAR